MRPGHVVCGAGEQRYVLGGQEGQHAQRRGSHQRLRLSNRSECLFLQALTNERGSKDAMCVTRAGSTPAALQGQLLSEVAEAPSALRLAATSAARLLPVESGTPPLPAEWRSPAAAAPLHSLPLPAALCLVVSSPAAHAQHCPGSQSARAAGPSPPRSAAPPAAATGPVQRGAAGHRLPALRQRW